MDGEELNLSDPKHLLTNAPGTLSSDVLGKAHPEPGGAAAPLPPGGKKPQELEKNALNCPHTSYFRMSNYFCLN